MDALVESLIQLNKLADGRAYESPLRLTYNLRAQCGEDSRVSLIAVAAMLAVPEQLSFGYEPALLRERLASDRLYSDAATAFAVGAWAAACQLVDADDVPPLAAAPRESLSELFMMSLSSALAPARPSFRPMNRKAAL